MVEEFLGPCGAGFSQVTIVLIAECALSVMCKGDFRDVTQLGSSKLGV